MLKPSDIKRLREEISPEQKVNSLLGPKLQNAIDDGIREAISKCKSKVNLILKADVCKEPDEDIRSALKVLGYDEVKVTSDYP